jgi:hypothetical protein
LINALVGYSAAGDRSHEISHNHSRRAIVLGVGLATGGMFAAALGQLAAAPTAHADITDIVNAIDTSVLDGSDDFSDAAMNFTSGDYSDALALSFAGLDDDLIAPQYDILIDGYEALVGASLPDASTALVFPIPDTPTDFADTQTDVTTLINDATASFNIADTDFAGSDIYDGLIQTAFGLSDYVDAGQTGLIGLLDSLGL